MLKNITLNNVGPSAEMNVEFGDRLTVITGDNGLGKSFLLDVAWWALTSYWPAEINPSLTSGGKALPTRSPAHGRRENGKQAQDEAGLPGRGKIRFELQSKAGEREAFASSFVVRDQSWTKQLSQPALLGLTVYAMSDGSFAVWDPARNCWPNTVDGYDEDRAIGYIFSPSQIWGGLTSTRLRRKLCNGLIVDWVTWQREGKETFERLKKVLAVLSPNPLERLEPGNITRMSIDGGQMPTIKMPYGQEVPVAHASAGIRRILTFAYVLTWAWEEHLAAANLIEEAPSDQVTLLVDEVEAHLHPQWQRRIVPALMQVVNELSPNISVQLVITTHSPLVMASLEPIFAAEADLWLDLDYASNDHGDPEVLLTEREFIKMGDASDWLTSEAFDLESARSLEASTALEKAAVAMSDPNFGGEAAISLHAELAAVLGGIDPFWARWRYVAERKGWPI
jgi:AAA domain, putative AbiEii toxin, Type IV TA system